MYYILHKKYSNRLILTELCKKVVALFETQCGGHSIELMLRYNGEFLLFSVHWKDSQLNLPQGTQDREKTIRKELK